MSVALAQIAREYSRDRQIVVNTSFISPKAQEAQINEGASADILITPQLPWIEKLKTQGLVDIYSQAELARNRLALVGPLDSTLDVQPSQPFPIYAVIQRMNGDAAFVVGNPETLMEGVYGKEALRNLDTASELEPYTLYIKQLDQMFDMVTKHGAYGLFFYSSTISRDGLRVLDVLPESAYHSIIYYGVVIAGDNMDGARKFMEYMKTPAARQILRENGFSVN